MITGYQKLVWSRSAGAPCLKDQVRQAKADFSLVLRAPGKQHGSGTGDHWHGGKSPSRRQPLV